MVDGNGSCGSSIGSCYWCSGPASNTNALRRRNQRLHAHIRWYDCVRGSRSVEFELEPRIEHGRFWVQVQIPRTANLVRSRTTGYGRVVVDYAAEVRWC